MEKSSLIMNLFATLVVTRILCIFKLFLESKAYNEIFETSRLEFLVKISGNKICRKQHPRRRKKKDLILLIVNITSNSQTLTKAKFLEGDKLPCCISIGKLSSFKNPFATITTCLNLALDTKELFVYHYKFL